MACCGTKPCINLVQLSLDVRGKNTLEESLDLYVQGELMEGDNQYFCEEAGKKVDSLCTSSTCITDVQQLSSSTCVCGHANSLPLLLYLSETCCCEQVDAIKRSCIKSLPHTLVIHLKRFEFDYETMTRMKIKDRSVSVA